jgi:hypothetical protein
MNKIKSSSTPMIEMADSSPQHIELKVPRNPDKPKAEKAVMTRTEMANTIAWARKDEIDQARMPKNLDYKL